MVHEECYEGRGVALRSGRRAVGWWGCFIPAWNGVDYMRGNIRGSYDIKTVGVLPGYIEHGALLNPSFESNYHDVAFGVPSRDTSSFLAPTLGESVGGYDISFGDSSSFDVVHLGYPHFLECEGSETPQTHDCTDIDVTNREVLDSNHVASYVPGGLMLGCEGTTSGEHLDDNPFNPRAVLLPDCSFVGGASGGPWLSDFNRTTGDGVVRTVLSGQPSDAPGTLLATYFGDEERDLYECMSSISFGYDECRDDWDIW